MVEDNRFNTAFDLLMNGRWVDSGAKEAFFRYLDGEIDLKEAERLLL